MSVANRTHAIDSYGEILKPHAKDWEREVSIQTGKIQAGQGPDFPGSLGETDVSGIVENTADAPRPQEIAQCMDDAGWQSSTEDYVITDDGPEGETNSPVLVTVDEEAEEGAAAEGANGADRPSSIGATKLSV